MEFLYSIHALYFAEQFNYIPSQYWHLAVSELYDNQE